MNTNQLFMAPTAVFTLTHSYICKKIKFDRYQFNELVYEYQMIFQNYITDMDIKGLINDGKSNVTGEDPSQEIFDIRVEARPLDDFLKQFGIYRISCKDGLIMPILLFEGIITFEGKDNIIFGAGLKQLIRKPEVE